jgi:hypothetical protein
LAAQIKAHEAWGAHLTRNHRVDQVNGQRKPVWGAERIRGELLKLGVKVSKRTI